LDDVAVPMAVDADQTISDLRDALTRLHELHLLQLGQDAAGALYCRCRADESARVAALLDDYAQGRRN
jgi:hypothetical protein